MNVDDGGTTHEYLHEAEDSQFTDQPALSTVSLHTCLLAASRSKICQYAYQEGSYSNTQKIS